MKSMQLQKIERLRKMYQLFHRIQESSALAGWVFEVIVHRLFSGGWRSGPVPQPIRMNCESSSGSPAFLTDPSSSAPDTSPPLHANTRAVTQVSFDPRELSDVTLDNNRYYVPSTTNHPLFDSFTINFTPPNGVDPVTCIISVFQTTASQRHKGSAEDYPHICKS